MPPAHFALVIFEIVSHFMPWPAWTEMLSFVLPHVAGMTDTCHHAQLWVENFLPGLALNCNPFNLYFPSSGMNHSPDPVLTALSNAQILSL
jgi:hypothetical protein